VAVLPEAIYKYFDDTTRHFDVVHKPNWLISDVEADVWLVDNKGDMREVGGEVKGGTNIRWDKDFPGGLLTDRRYALVRKQFKSVFIWSHDGPLALSGNSLRDIKFFHVAVYWFLEFLDVRYGDQFREVGLAVASIDDLVDFFDLYKFGGVTATSDMIARWESFLRTQRVDPSDPAAVRGYLLVKDAYGKDGRLKSKFVAKALLIKAHRVRQLEPLSSYLSQFESSPSSTVGDDSSWSTAAIVRVFTVLSRALATIPEFCTAELAQPEKILEALKPFRRREDSRTRTLPSVVGKGLLGGCCNWMLDIYPKIFDCIKHVEQALEPEDDKSEAGIALRLLRAEQKVAIDPKLQEIAGRWRRTPSQPSRDQRSQVNMPIILILLRLHSAVCYSLVGLLACCRRREVTEILEPSADQLAARTVQIALRKTGVDNSRRVMHKPIPQIVSDCLSSLKALKAICLNIQPRDDSQLHKMAFFQFGLRGLGTLEPESVNGLLIELSLYFDLRGENGSTWLVRSHELRRYFAMTFFHMGGEENSLPTLTWFMGHANIERTWRYVKESLTGKELSVAEAAMARSAICSDDQSENVQILRSVVLNHFGCSSIELLASDEIQDYLEMLAEEKTFRAKPVQIQCGGHKVFTILLSLTGTMSNA